VKLDDRLQQAAAVEYGFETGPFQRKGALRVEVRSRKYRPVRD